MNGHDHNQKGLVTISTRNYVKQTFTSLQINKILAQEQQFTPV